VWLLLYASRSGPSTRARSAASGTDEGTPAASGTTSPCPARSGLQRLQPAEQRPRLFGLNFPMLLDDYVLKDFFQYRD